MGRALRRAALGFAVLAGAAVGVWRLRPPAAPPPPANLLLVSLDAVRADRLGYAGYAGAHTPHLDALAAGGLVFSQATTAVPLTLPAHASLLTGTFPARHGLRDDWEVLGEEQVTLAEVLREAGYRTGGFVGSFALDSRWGLHQGFDRYFDDVSAPAAAGKDPAEGRADEVVAAAVSWLDEDPARPFFAWVHLPSPLPEGRSAAYDAEVARTDSLVGRVLHHLALRGLAGRTVVVAVGDHGESLGEHGEETHGFFLYDATVRVPLLLSGPGVRAGRVDDPVRTVDVVPTVLQALALPVPKGVQGRGLLSAGGPPAPVALSESWVPRLHYGWSELLSVRDGRYKLIQAPRPELYDLVEDPGETRDIAAADPARAAALQKALAEAVAQAGGTALKVRSALGRRHLDDRPRDDPKDKVGPYHLLRAATRAAREGSTEEALALAGQALAADPEVVEGHVLVGSVQARAGRQDAAVDGYRRALALDPEHAGAAFGLALAHRELGRLDEAEAGFERARELDPRGTKALWHLADLWVRKGRLAEAEAALKEALDKQADRPPFLLKLGECYIEMKRYAEAEAVLKEALAARPALERVHIALALVHEGRGDPGRAIAEYEAALAQEPGDPRASFNLARLLQQRGRLHDAADRLRASVAAAPERAAGHLHLARVLLELGDLDGARRAARQGLAAHPDPPAAAMAHLVLADVYTRQGLSRDAARERAAAKRVGRTP